MLKNITLSAEQDLLREAREKARQEHTTLNSVFRSWLARYVGQGRSGAEYVTVMEQLSYADAGRSFTRDELNER